jgi:hypothetical protein
MSGMHLPPDHSRGDESTIGGYAAVHARPAAFEGVDGMSYSVELCTDRVDDADGDGWGGYLLFLRWRRVGEPGVDGHLETDYIVRADTDEQALAELGRMPLATVKATLDALIRKSDAGVPRRKWWDVMRDEGGAT